MKLKIISVSLILSVLLGLSACSSVTLLKGGDFSRDYKSFIKSMRKDIPVSVEFEQYLKTEGFSEDKLITDTDSVTIRELVNALAQVKIISQVDSASNFAVRHYTFVTEKGEKYTFEFFGSYLKCEGKFYETENSLKFISIRPTEKKSGEFTVALDEAYDGKGEYAGKMFISCRMLDNKSEKTKSSAFGDFELSPEAEISAPAGQRASGEVIKTDVNDFFLNFETLKGQDNEYYIFNIIVEKGIIISMEYNAVRAEAEMQQAQNL